MVQLAVIVRSIFFFINNIYGTFSYLFWYVVLFPLKFLFPSIFFSLEKLLYENLIGMVAFWGYLSGHTIVHSGCDLSDLLNDESLFMINHQTPTDIPVLMYYMFTMKGALQNCMWVMDWIIMFINIGWVAKGHGDFFLLQPSDYRKFKFLFSRSTESQMKVSEITRMKNHTIKMLKTRERKWIMLFPEGGFLHKRKASSHRFASKNNLPLLENVTLPRSGAIETLVQASNESGNKIKWIIDITVAYEQKPVSFSAWFLGQNGCETIHVHTRKYPISELMFNGYTSVDSDHVNSWVTKRFIEKDEMITRLGETNKFEENAIKSIVPYPHIRNIISHLFCIATIFIFIKLCFL